MLSGSDWPEREGVVSDEGLALPHQEGAVLAAALAVLLQELLGHLAAVAATAQLAVEPALGAVLLVVVALLQRRRETVSDAAGATSAGR